jgi:hypothetical protein
MLHAIDTTGSSPIPWWRCHAPFVTYAMLQGCVYYFFAMYYVLPGGFGHTRASVSFVTCFERLYTCFQVPIYRLHSLHSEQFFVQLWSCFNNYQTVFPMAQYHMMTWTILRLTCFSNKHHMFHGTYMYASFLTFTLWLQCLWQHCSCLNDYKIVFQRMQLCGFKVEPNHDIFLEKNMPELRSITCSFGRMLSMMETSMDWKWSIVCRRWNYAGIYWSRVNFWRIYGSISLWKLSLDRKSD